MGHQIDIMSLELPPMMITHKHFDINKIFAANTSYHGIILMYMFQKDIFYLRYRYYCKICTGEIDQNNPSRPIANIGRTQNQRWSSHHSPIIHSFCCVWDTDVGVMNLFLTFFLNIAALLFILKSDDQENNLVWLKVTL